MFPVIFICPIASTIGFPDETIKGTKYGNVLYIEVVPEMIRLLMAEDESDDNDVNDNNERNLLIVGDP